MARARRNSAALRRSQATALWRDGASYREIAAHLGTSTDAVAQYLRAARRQGADLPRRKPEPWTEQDDATLLADVRDGLDVAACADTLARPVDATARRIGRLRSQGLLPPLNEPWSPEQDERLVTGYTAGHPLRELASQTQRPAHQVNTRVGSLRRSGADLPPRKPRWTDEDRGRLARLYREGTSLRQLEHEFGKTRGTITSQLRTLRRLGYDLNRD